MRQRVQITLAVALWALLAGIVPLSSVAEEDEQNAPQAVTTPDAEIPVDELALLIKPLTKQELLVEADAWQALLKEKAEEIAKAEIRVKRQNREIKKAEEVQDAVEEAKDRLKDVKRKAEEAKASGDMEKVQETEAAAREAQEKIQNVSATVEEAADKAHEALGRVQDAVEGVDPKAVHRSARPQTRRARPRKRRSRRSTR